MSVAFARQLQSPARHIRSCRCLLRTSLPVCTRLRPHCLLSHTSQRARVPCSQKCLGTWCLCGSPPAPRRDICNHIERTYRICKKHLCRRVWRALRSLRYKCSITLASPTSVSLAMVIVLSSRIFSGFTSNEMICKTSKHDTLDQSDGSQKIQI